MKLAVLLVLSAAAGMWLGAMGAGRYEYVKLSDYPARFDRWTGRVEVIGMGATDEAKKQWVHRASMSSADPAK